MIVWGGDDSAAVTLNTGGRYNPATDSWTPTTTGANVPSARALHTAVWTGTEMIVWGGRAPTTALEHGRPLQSGGGQLDADVHGRERARARDRHTAVWTGTEMIVWGGTTARLSTNTRRALQSGDGQLDGDVDEQRASRRRATHHTAVWTGTEMIVWGGSDGPRRPRTPAGATTRRRTRWTPTSTGANVPAGRVAAHGGVDGHRDDRLGRRPADTAN